jgi:hypothetical protein
MFREAVHELVRDGLRTLSHPVQGYIPKGGIDKETNLCTVRIPNPHGGVHPSSSQEGNYIELKAIPVPFFYKGFLGGILDLVQQEDRGVIVGFKGSNMANPYIVSPLPAVLNHDKLDQTVDERKSVIADRTTNVGGSHQLVTPDTKMLPTPSVQTFSELTPPGPPRQFGLQDAPKLSQFNGLQSQLKTQMDSSVSRITTPTVVARK